MYCCPSVCQQHRNVWTCFQYMPFLWSCNAMALSFHHTCASSCFNTFSRPVMTSVPILPHVRWLLRSVKARYRRLQLRWCSQPCRASTVSFRSKRPAVADLTINPLAYPRPHPASLECTYPTGTLCSTWTYWSVFLFASKAVKVCKVWCRVGCNTFQEENEMNPQRKMKFCLRCFFVCSWYAEDMFVSFSSFLIQSPYCYFWNYVWK